MVSLLSGLLAEAEAADNASDGLIGRLLAREPESVTAGLVATPAAQSRRMIAERLDAYRETVDVVRETTAALGLAARPIEAVWDVYLPLAQHLIGLRADPHSCLLVGIIGGPGAGKTTLTRFLDVLLRKGFGYRSAPISSDDFYLPREERLKRGLRWRGTIESHDVEALRDAMTALRAVRAMPRVPRFDPERDDRAGFESVPGPLDFCLFEGWTTAALVERLEGAAVKSLDYTIFLKADVEFLKRARLEKEARIQQRSQNRRGLPPNEMQSFWDAVIAPGLERYVNPFEGGADLVAQVGAGHRIAAVSTATAARPTKKVATA